MSTVAPTQTSFAAGELDPILYGRSDLGATQSGAATLTNVAVAPTGSLTRRAGLKHLETLDGPGRLVAFPTADGKQALLIFGEKRLQVFLDGRIVAETTAPWPAAKLDRLRWVQSADVLILTHPETAPRRLIHGPVGAWRLEEMGFYVTESGRRQAPFEKLAEAGVTVTPSDTSGAITISAGGPVFAEGHVGARLRIKDREVKVTGYTNRYEVSAETVEDLPDTAQTIDWAEEVFSQAQGWPVAACFHQDRLVLAGTAGQPHRLWLSRTGDLYNFDMGTGEADAAIAVALLGEELDAITALASGRQLRIFTSGAEWSLRGRPLTPASVRVEQHSRMGSPTGRYIPPQDVGGATLFAARLPGQIREFVPHDIDQTYTNVDLGLRASHMIPTPADMAYAPAERRLYVAGTAGELVTAALHRGEHTVAWSRYATDGAVASLAVLATGVHAIIARGDSHVLAVFDPAYSTDSAVQQTAQVATTSWDGLDHLEGETVRVRADGADAGSHTVTDGAIELAEPAEAIEAGLAFTHEVAPLPPLAAASRGIGGPARRARLVRAVFHLHATAALRVDTGQGPRRIPVAAASSPAPGAPATVTGAVSARGLGWQSAAERPLWRISDDAPLPFTLLATTNDVRMST